MKNKLFFGAFAVFVFVCLFLFFFFGVARANGQQQMVPKHKAVSALGAHVYYYGDYSTNTIQTVGDVEYYQDKAQLGYVSKRQDNYIPVAQAGYYIKDYDYVGNYEVPDYLVYSKESVNSDVGYDQVSYVAKVYRDVSGGGRTTVGLTIHRLSA